MLSNQMLVPQAPKATLSQIQFFLAEGVITQNEARYLLEQSGVFQQLRSAEFEKAMKDMVKN